MLYPRAASHEQCLATLCLQWLNSLQDMLTFVQPAMRVLQPMEESLTRAPPTTSRHMTHTHKPVEAALNSQLRSSGTLAS